MEGRLREGRERLNDDSPQRGNTIKYSFIKERRTNEQQTIIDEEKKELENKLNNNSAESDEIFLDLAHKKNS